MSLVQNKIKVGQWEVDFGEASKAMDEAFGIMEVNAKLLDYTVSVSRLGGTIWVELLSKSDNDDRSFSLIYMSISTHNDKAYRIFLSSTSNAKTHDPDQFHEVANQIKLICQEM